MGISVVRTPAPDYAKLQWAAKIGTSAESMTTSTVYAGQPVVEGEFVYATAGRTLYKIKALDGSVAVQQVMDGKDRFGTIPPTIAGDMIYVALDGGMVEAFDKNTLVRKWTLGGLSAGGQNSCPVLVSEGRVYTGFYDSETGAQNYVCLTTAGKRVWSYANAGETIDQKIGHTAADHTKAGNCDLLHWILLLVVRHRENLAQRLMV